MNWTRFGLSVHEFRAWWPNRLRCGGRLHFTTERRQTPCDAACRRYSGPPARRIGFDNLNPIRWLKVTNIRLEASRFISDFLGKPNLPNGIIKNDVETILFFRKPGGIGGLQSGKKRSRSFQQMTMRNGSNPFGS